MPLGSVLIAVAAYLFGSIPSGYLLMRIFRKQDIRTIGSGNIGATNVLRSGSRGLGAATFFADMLKGCTAVWLGALVAPYLMAGSPVRSVEALAALFAVLGHMFPVWLGFKGGKGVATGYGVLIAASWPAGLLAGAAWLVMAGLVRISSAAALTSFALAPVLAYGIAGRGAALLALAVAVLVFIRHHANIRRLLAGTEPRIGPRIGQKS